MINDFGHGMITDKMINLIEKNLKTFYKCTQK